MSSVSAGYNLDGLKFTQYTISTMPQGPHLLTAKLKEQLEINTNFGYLAKACCFAVK